MKETETGGQNLDQVSDGQEKSTDIQKDMVSYESHRKLLGEKKARDAQLLDLQKKLSSYEETLAEKEGRKDDVIKSLRDKLAETETKYNSTKKNYAWNVLTGQLKAEAVKQGCVSPDKLIRLMAEDDLKGIDVDENFTINSDDLQRVIAKAKEENGDIGLFGGKKVNVNDMPSGTSIPATTTKSPKDMTPTELKAYIKQQATRK